MAVATGRRSKSINVSKQAVDRAGELLQQLPEKPKEALSLRDAIDQLQEEIRDALSKGYTYADLVNLLANRGIDISPATLKRYVSMGRNKGPKTRKSAAKTGVKRPRKPRAEQTDASTDAASTTSQSEAAPDTTAQPTSGRGRRKRSAAAQDTAQPAEEAPEAQSTRGRRSTAAKSATPARSTSGRGRRKTSAT